MCGSQWLGIVLMVLATKSATGDHFRGGAMSWKAVENNQIELLYQVSFTANIADYEGGMCKADGDNVTMKTYITCNECQGNDNKKKKMHWICSQLDKDDDTVYGEYTMLFDVPKNQFDITWENCCWIELQSPLGKPGARGWLMMAHVDVTPRADGKGINQSPISASLSAEKYYQGCQYELRIPASDLDNDDVRCRFADKAEGECSVKFPRACGKDINGKDTAGVTILPTCILQFNTTGVAKGNHLVNVIIEDFIPPYTNGKQPLSQVSLLMLLEVAEYSSTCAKPRIIDPPLCKTVRPEQELVIVIVAEPGDPSKPIYTIRTQKKPTGMAESKVENEPSAPGRKRKTYTWTPTKRDIGVHSLCYSALDDGRYTSGQVCTIIHVEYDPLYPLGETSRPSAGGEIKDTDIWTIRFNARIKQPKPGQSSTSIRIVIDATGEVVYEVDSSDTSKVFFDDTHFTFHPEIGVSDDSVRLELDEGVAVPMNGGCGSEAAVWAVNIVHGEVNTKPRYRCDEGTMEIDLPSYVEDGAECFIHVPTSGTTNGGVLTTSYQLCCSSSCPSVVFSPPPINERPPDYGPPGRPSPPGTK